jgi:hypothetical protein
MPPTPRVCVRACVQVVGNISDAQARLLVGSILLLLLVVSLAEVFCKKPPPPTPAGGAAAAAASDGPSALASSVWFAAFVGVVGGFATIITNSMGPLLNVYLLTLKLEPTDFVGTRVRACFNFLLCLRFGVRVCGRARVCVCE